jgi:hypothetical protein
MLHLLWVFIIEYLIRNFYYFFYVAVEIENNNKNMTSTYSQQTPNRGIQHYQSAPSFYPTPITSGNDSNGCYEFQHTASTPLLR